MNVSLNSPSLKPLQVEIVGWTVVRILVKDACWSFVASEYPSWLLWFHQMFKLISSFPVNSASHMWSKASEFAPVTLTHTPRPWFHLTKDLEPENSTICIQFLEPQYLWGNQVFGGPLRRVIYFTLSFQSTGWSTLVPTWIVFSDHRKVRWSPRAQHSSRLHICPVNHIPFIKPFIRATYKPRGRQAHCVCHKEMQGINTYYHHGNIKHWDLLWANNFCS